ncbi:MAG: DUF1559 domain-containing protein [Planctomycetaceae bacterium]
MPRGGFSRIVAAGGLRHQRPAGGARRLRLRVGATAATPPRCGRPSPPTSAPAGSSRRGARPTTAASPDPGSSRPACRSSVRPGWPAASSSPTTARIASHHPGGALAACGDGRVTFLDDSMDPAVLAALCTRHGGEADGSPPDG